MRVTSSASRGSSGGRIDGSRRPSIVLPVPGGPGEQQVVAAGGRELERAPRALLAAHVGEVGRLRLRLLVGRVDGRRPELAAQVGDRLGEVADRHGLDAAELRLAGRLGRAEDPLEPGAPRALGDRERTAHGPDAAVERELADRRVLGEPLGRNLARRREHRERDREVEARAFLPQARRREVDRDPLSAATRAAPSRSRCGRGASPPRRRGRRGRRWRSREAAVDVRLDLDAPRLEPDKSVGDGAREHASTLRRAVRATRVESLTTQRTRSGSTRSTRPRGGPCAG